MLNGMSRVIADLQMREETLQNEIHFYKVAAGRFIPTPFVAIRQH
jgi:hypothetical protein